MKDTYPSACIQILSSRWRAVPFAVRSINKLANPGNYPFMVHYFDDIYKSKLLRKALSSVASADVRFLEVPYSSPCHVPEAEMFYNRTEFEYVRRSFGINRKGYLHMCNFIINMYRYENTSIHDYDYLRVYDDEAGYLQKIPFEPAKFICDNDIELAALFYDYRLKDGKPHAGHIATKHKLFEFLTYYLDKYQIKPKSKELVDCLAHPDPEYQFHFLKWADSYVMKTSIFKSSEWRRWVKEINDHGGVYKYRWGDNEVYTLFGLMHYEYGVYDLGFVNDGFHHQSKYRRMQDIAPSIKHIDY